MRFFQSAMIMTGLSGAMAVLMGAYAAHGLAVHFPAAVETVKIAAHYQLVHTGVILALLILMLRLSAPFAVKFAVCVFMLGILLFSGSLYALAFGAPRILGPVTPVGGLCLVVGWLSLIWVGVSVKRSHPISH